MEYEQLFIHGNQIRYVQVSTPTLTTPTCTQTLTQMPDDFNVSVLLERQVKGLLGGGEVTKRKRMSRARLNRQLEEKAIVRAYKLGKGRATNT